MLNLDGKKILVTGGAGFVGSHLVDRLIEHRATVTVVDSMITGNRANLNQHQDSSLLTLIEADVVEDRDKFLNQDFELIFHLASPASPKDFEKYPVKTYLPNSFGTHYLLEYAHKKQAKFLLASTSEAYGDPQEHPQKETYWGHVNPVGVRSPYDVSKRFGEMATMTWVRHGGVDARIVRIFNTYGPRMGIDDGRVMPTLISQALNNEPMTIHGNGEQTRSFCYVSDLVEYILRAMNYNQTKGEVINIGNPDEYTVNELAELIIKKTGGRSEVMNVDRPEDDPDKRRPDISKARKLLDYEPKVAIDEGLDRTIKFFQETLLAS